jgi:hypothetical protein
MSASDDNGDIPIDQELSAKVIAAASAVEAALADGRALALSDEALQAMLAAAVKAYSSVKEAGRTAPAVSPRSGVSATDVMNTASGLLKSTDVSVFELGMWQGWTGR